MKRSKALNSITKVLERWQNSHLDDKTSEEILQALEKLKIITPPDRVLHQAYFEGELCNVHGCEWTPEKKEPKSNYIPVMVLNKKDSRKSNKRNKKRS